MKRSTTFDDPRDHTARSSRLEKICKAVFMGFTLLMSATPGLAASDVSISRTLVSAGPGCTVPSYNFPITGNFTTDDGGGDDWVTVVVFDSAYHVLDVDNVALPGGGSANISYTFANSITARPIHVRVFDTTSQAADTDAGLTLAVESPLLAEMIFDPADDDAACNSIGNGPEIQIRSQTGAAIVVPGSSSTLVETMEIITPAPTQFFIAYSAECAVNGAESNWVGVTIDVDGQIVNPTSVFQAFCSGAGTGGYDEWIAARALGVIEVPAGAHDISVRGELRGLGGTGWRWDDRSLVVTVPEPGQSALIGSGLIGLLLLGLTKSRRERRRSAPPARRSLRATTLAIATLMTLASGVASAQTVINSRFNPNFQIINSSTPVTIEPSPGSLRMTLTTARAERLHITLTAECFVSSTNDSTTWLGLRLLMDGVQIAPTGTNFAFCGSDGDGGSNWTSVSTTTTLDLPGDGLVHSLTITGEVEGFTTGESAGIDDLSLIVLRTANPN